MRQEALRAIWFWVTLLFVVNGSARADEGTRLYELVIKDTLTSDEVVWLGEVSKGKSTFHETATIKLGMSLMAHPEQAETLVPVLIEIYRALAPGERDVVIGLLGGNNIRVHSPSETEKDIALIAPELNALKQPNSLVRSTSGGSVLPDVLRSNQSIIGFLCSVPPTGPSFYDPYFLMGRFKGDAARQCVTHWFEQERNEDRRRVLAGSLLRFGDMRGLSLILKELQRTGRQEQYRDVEWAAATGSTDLFDFIDHYLAAPAPRSVFFRECYFHGNDSGIPKLIAEAERRSRGDVETLHELTQYLGDEVSNEATMSSDLKGFQSTIPFLIKAVEHQDQITSSKALELLNFIADCRTRPATSEYWIQRITSAAVQLPADFVRQGAAAWKSWFEKHRTEFLPASPMATAIFSTNEPLDPVSVDQETIKRSVAKVTAIHSMR